MNFLQALRGANLRRVPDFNAGDLFDWSLAERGNELAGETGEACNELKKLLRADKAYDARMHEHGFSNEALIDWLRERNERIEKAKTELADVIICVDLIAAQLGVDLEQIVRAKFNATSDKIGSKVKL